MFTHGFSWSQSISIASHFSNEPPGVTQEFLRGEFVLVLGFFISAFVAHPEANANEVDLLVHLLGAMTTEREYFFVPLVVSLLWRWEAKGRGVLVICVLAGGTAEPRWCVGMSELYIKNGQGNGLTGSERSPSCSCKLLKLSLCLLLLQMFLWVSLPPGSNLWGAEQHCWKRDSLGSEGWGTSPLHGCWSHNKVTSPCSLLCSEFAQESGILWLLFPLYHLSARLRGVLGHIWKLPLNFDACLVEPAGV